MQYLGDLGCLVDVIENDKISVPEVAARKPDGVVVSPGPGRPEDSGISLEVAEMLTGQVPAASSQHHGHYKCSLGSS